MSTAFCPEEGAGMEWLLQQRLWHASVLVRTCCIPFYRVDLRLVCAVLQFIAGMACLRALWISRRKSGSRLTNYLIFHTFALWIVNLAGVITAALAFQWLFGSTKVLDTESWSTRRCFPDNGQDLGLYTEDYVFFETARLLAKLRKLTLTSNIAFALSGVLTDAMLVSRIYSGKITGQTNELITFRSGVVDRFGRLHFVPGQISLYYFQHSCS